ncbi:bifunctional DNA-formamidopyrimidine glycosylase/DNA-(apurinic or apyrimidinic site) lyase [Brytella acorum]|uniref:Formamidopyrimidine-DNA glycosylase n=1 Tax=Brytella acorum TaxID=2959299 RepID=A0AA35UPB1_9PROT|nr:bifunctional DNA-formamidopyrimidine glycosylase/DNA-(apurinic or apyrimidinic site) lyase [Brytella acorum]MDF3624503.1 bifunctional DNA-formamidopyrimidine glycosylase/DNA-(apurinic or apyrimidinic site) lyase [Brytella acorum]CAI9119647.1 bifunctional DNA-formamidopyrimidine glycosylase/DNA-(apurinic or apyrimidinic site) lyase [Brytella acorum]
MPELPEVETAMRGLRTAIEGHVITRAIVARHDLRWAIPEDFAPRVVGKRVLDLRRRGKYILIRLSDDLTVLLHLGMSGRVFIARPEAREGVASGSRRETARAHEHVTFFMDDDTRVGMIDPRRFGAVLLLTTSEENSHPLIAALGVEPLDAAFLKFPLGKFAERRRAPVKNLLLDQKVIAGLGNIYVCEALHRAEIHPAREAGSLTPAEWRRLMPVIQDVLIEAVNSGGSSLRDYAQPGGEKGGFQDFHRVYGREGRGCADCPGPPTCGGVERIVQAGRSTFLCPMRQPL